jgi:hypothetical protein
MDDTVLNRLFGPRDSVTIKQIAAYFRISVLSVKRRLKHQGYPTLSNNGFLGARRLDREQVRRLFPQDQP